MTHIKRFDRIGFYYTFENYLCKHELDHGAINYFENNNIQIGSLICFFDIIKNDIHYIVTTNKDFVHKIISITKCNCTDNMIYNNTFYYNGYKFIIKNNISTEHVEETIGITQDDIKEYDEKLDKIIINEILELCDKQKDYFKSFNDGYDKALFSNLMPFNSSMADGKK
jgi:hypothetical protein